MKRILSIILTLFLAAGFVFAAEESEGDEYDDDYVYDINGKGDQYLKLNLGAIFPLNFGGQVKGKLDTNDYGYLYTGGELEVGYYRFMNKWLALGGEAEISYNLSVGNKIMVMIPVTFGAMFQKTIGNFEFPVFLTAGFGYETWANYDYFPSLVTKASAGVFYRINESFSVGATGSFMWVPQWYIKNSDYNKNGLFANANIALRYHF